MRSSLIPLGVVTGVLVIGTVVAAVSQPASDRTRGLAGERRIPVRSSVVVCPNPTLPPGSQAELTVAIPPGPPAPAPGDAASVSALGGAGGPRLGIKARGRVAGISLSASAAPALVGQGRGSLAPGFSAQHTIHTPSGPFRGLSSVMCAAPGTGFWFVGTSTAPQRRASLFLTNNEQVSAIVDVFPYGPNGPAEVSGGRGLTVRPGQQRELVLAALVPGVPELAVNVVVRSGRVAAALRDQAVSLGAPGGVDWVPVAADPATRVVLPPVPAAADGRGAQVLSLLTPGEAAGTARIRLVDKDGSFTPIGAEQVELASGKLVTVDLVKAARGEPVAVVVDSDVPVLAGERVTHQPAGKLPDVAFLAGASPVVDAAVVPNSQGTPAMPGELYLTAPGRGARVTVLTIGGAEVDRRDVEVAEGTTRRVGLAPAKGDRSSGHAVVVQPDPGGGAVYGSWALTERARDGELFTALPLRDDGATVVVPRVAHDLSAGTRLRR